jgi:plastocyanin
MAINRSRIVLLVALTVAVGGCGAAGGTSSTTSTTPPSLSAVLGSSTATSCPTPAPTPIPTLASSTETASEAPADAIPIKMTAVDAGPRFQPDNVTTKAGTVIFFLENIPGTLFSPDHNMQIGPACVSFYGDGSIRTGQVLAGTRHIQAKETATFTVKDLTPGIYVFWCSVEGANGNHASFGMVGTLTITP